jgi:hypothetical protein
VLTKSGTYPWSFVTQIFHNGQRSRGGDRKTFEVIKLTSFSLWYIGNHSRFWLLVFYLVVYLLVATKDFKIIRLSTLLIWAYLMKVIQKRVLCTEFVPDEGYPKTRIVHRIRTWWRLSTRLVPRIRTWWRLSKNASCAQNSYLMKVIQKRVLCTEFVPDEDYPRVLCPEFVPDEGYSKTCLVHRIRTWWRLSTRLVPIIHTWWRLSTRLVHRIRTWLRLSTPLVHRIRTWWRLSTRLVHKIRYLRLIKNLRFYCSGKSS